VRITTILARILALKQTRILDVHLEPEGLVLDAAPTTRVPICSGCLKRVHAVHDTYEGRRWRHLDVAGMRLWLRYEIRRVRCRRCGVTVELVPWAEPQSWFTRDFESHVAYLAQRADKTTLSDMMRIGWATVGSIIERVVARLRPDDALDGLRLIGVDELSYRRHHQYVTVVIDHERGAVVWAREGKDAATLQAFFEELGKERCAKLEAVTLDLSAAYIKAVTEASPEARLIFDRFHVQRLAHDALDQVRRQQWRAADAHDRDAIKGTRFVLQKNPWNLSDVEQGKLTDVQRTNRPLYRAYLLKETLARILDGGQVNVARDKLLDWIGWATRSRLPPFRRVTRTIKKGSPAGLMEGRTGIRAHGAA